MKLLYYDYLFMYIDYLENINTLFYIFVIVIVKFIGLYY